MLLQLGYVNVFGTNVIIVTFKFSARALGNVLYVPQIPVKDHETYRYKSMSLSFVRLLYMYVSNNASK